MLQSVGIGYKPIIKTNFSKKTSDNKINQTNHPVQYSLSSANTAIAPINTKLSKNDAIKYIYLVNLLKDFPLSENSFGLSANKQLDILLKTGKLLSNQSNDSSTMLNNLYDIATKPRAQGLDSRKIISNILDTTINPRIVSQTFGDIPQVEIDKILSQLDDNHPVKKNPQLMDVAASGTCAAASNEVNLADKYPAEFARWVSKLSSNDEKLYLNVDVNSISSNKLEAIEILNLLGAKREGSFSFDKWKIHIPIDKGALIRAKIQNDHWDLGERNIADVLVQSAIMQLGSQNTYDSLTDERGGEFNSSSQGLIEIEKTFVESLIKNKEITSLVYQQLDDEQNLVGYNCSFDKIEKHITDTIDSGEDVILGYVLTNETAGNTKSEHYNPIVDGKANKVINGHEITIVDYKKDKNGQTKFICVDTDDNNPNFVECDAKWLLPKIHHAGYPAKIVEQDAGQIMKNLLQ